MWLFILMLPAGYWGLFAARGIQPGNARANATAVVFVLAALTIAFVAVPWMFGLPRVGAWEWVPAVGGAAAGVAAARAILAHSRRRSVTTEAAV